MIDLDKFKRDVTSLPLGKIIIHSSTFDCPTNGLEKGRRVQYQIGDENL